MWHRQRTESHEKSMGSYELFAWRDAMAIAEFIAVEYTVPKARKAYESHEHATISKFEREHAELLTEFIQKSESQRPAFLRRITKSTPPLSESTVILFLVLALLGVLRSKNIIELRDRFRTVLAPGRGNRITTSAIYAFSNEMRSVYSYEWPYEVFDAIGEFDDSSESEEEE